MAQTQQVLHFAKITKLKGLTSLDEIRFDEKPLTAVMGPNGCGKSTILHALACCYKPLANSAQPSYRFPEFFTPTTDSTWAGSKFCLEHSFREGQQAGVAINTCYLKAGERWAPRYERRPERHVVFIGIESCVPEIERESYTSVIRYETDAHADDISIAIRAHMGTIFNRQYTEINTHRGRGKRYSGLAYAGTRYSSLSMGAGEQRVLNILTQIFNSPKFGLILIDELDLLLHTDALKKLIRIIAERAENKNLQVIFTTHREAILDLRHLVSIKHIYQAPGRTYCFSDTKPDAIRRLTGEVQQPIEIFVEDDLAKSIVEFELLRLQMKRFTAITEYGAAINCFTIAAGLSLLPGADFENKLFLQDGDLYVSVEERQARIDKVLTGTEPATVTRKAMVLGGLRRFVADGRATPEVTLHQMIRELNQGEHPGYEEIIQLAQGIEAVDDNHSLVHQILTTLAIDASAGHSKIVATAARSPLWSAYVMELCVWLEQRRDEFVGG